MKTIFLFIMLEGIGAAGFCQGLSLQHLGDPFQAASLAVRWEAPTNAWPKTVWVYRLTGKIFPSAAISNLVAIGGFTTNDLKQSNNNEILYKSPGRFPEVQLSVSSGNVEYLHKTDYGPTNMAKDVPAASKIPVLTTNFLRGLEIPISEIEQDQSGAPIIHYWQPERVYYLPEGMVTNIEFRAASFRREIDGAPFLSMGTGGDGEIDFGEHGQIIKIDITWKGLQKYRTYRTANVDKIIQWIRGGRAVQGPLPMNSPDIDWSKVQRLTIHKAQFAYYAGDTLMPTDWVMPILSLWTTVNTLQGNTDLEIDCPIIDDTALK